MQNSATDDCTGSTASDNDIESLAEGQELLISDCEGDSEELDHGHVEKLVQQQQQQQRGAQKWETATDAENGTTVLENRKSRQLPAAAAAAADASQECLTGSTADPYVRLVSMAPHYTTLTFVGIIDKFQPSTRMQQTHIPNSIFH